jgi:hypothetical protein
LPSTKSTPEKTEEERNADRAEEFNSWREAFGEQPDMAQLEPWYIRLGIPKGLIENADNKTVKDLGEDIF